MNLFHCTHCHHEWESSKDTSSCDWCHAAGQVIDRREPWCILDMAGQIKRTLLRRARTVRYRART